MAADETIRIRRYLPEDRGEVMALAPGSPRESRPGVTPTRQAIGRGARPDAG